MTIYEDYYNLMKNNEELLRRISIVEQALRGLVEGHFTLDQFSLEEGVVVFHGKDAK